jgi:hypothetical protein
VFVHLEVDDAYGLIDGSDCVGVEEGVAVNEGPGEVADEGGLPGLVLGGDEDA